MAININLYPPIVNTYMPAFLADSADTSLNTCRIYFSLSQYNNIEDIANVQVTLRDQNTNNSMLLRKRYPSEVMITSLLEDTSKKSADRFYIEIAKDDVEGGWDINTYYKVQVRFTRHDAEPAPSNNKLDAWLAANAMLFSEWSTVCLIRGISTPTLDIDGIINPETGTYEWSTANSNLIGTLVFAQPEETDILKSYQVRVFDSADNLLTDSELLYASSYNNVNGFNYTLKYNFQPNNTYTIRVDYETMTGYKDFITRTFTVAQRDATEFNISISAVTDEENGRIGINIKGAAGITGTLVIRRSSSKENFTIWEDLHEIPLTGEAIKTIWYDMTIESDIWYKYSVQRINEANLRGMVKELRSPVLVSFEHMFLTTKDRQLKIKFNPNVSSYKKIIQESRTDTLGSKYPFVRRNGYAEYTQFPIGGLISFFMDEEELFTSREELFGDSLKLYADYNDNHRIENVNNYIYERKFRDEVINFLYNEDVKLFRSPTEGNLIVKVMEASLTPNTQVSRYLYSFTANAYELADCTVEEMKKYNILEGRDE